MLFFYFRYLSEYVYDCGPKSLQSLGISCTSERVKAALISHADLINSVYKTDIRTYAANQSCIGKYWLWVARDLFYPI